MNRTIGYWIEKLSAILIGITIFILSFKNWDELGFLDSRDFLDNIVGISSTLFGFLLAILTLIIQSESPTIIQMKNHGSFHRLVSLNKITVLSSIISCIFSFLIGVTKEILEFKFIELLKILACLNAALFGFVILNTLIFTLIFYRIINNDSKIVSR